MAEDWLSLPGQTTLLRQRALQREHAAETQAQQDLVRARAHAALAELATSETGQIFLDGLVLVLLSPVQDDFGRGRHHLVLEILANVRDALAKRAIPQERLHYGYTLGGWDATPGVE